MERIIGRFAPHAYALLRIISGIMFMLHGTQKLLGWPGQGMPHPLPPLVLAAGIIEAIGGFLIAIGLLTSWAAFISSGEMAVAYFKGHAFNGSFIPTVNQGELAVLYCFLFLYIAAAGAGIWSVDNAMRRGRRVSA
ncbi:MAG TPA: DoxX family protein [Thermoanaerobaculia bacterium]|jgi:putative oxidoreductase